MFINNLEKIQYEILKKKPYQSTLIAEFNDLSVKV